MRKKIASLALFFAWLCANGALLDAVQVIAWGKMFAGNAGSMNPVAALQETFNPAKRCEMCRSIAAVRESAQQQLPQTVEPAAEKILLALHSPAPVVLANDPGDWPAVRASLAPSRTEAVPVPPPRV